MKALSAYTIALIYLVSGAMVLKTASRKDFTMSELLLRNTFFVTPNADRYAADLREMAFKLQDAKLYVDSIKAIR